MKARMRAFAFAFAPLACGCPSLSFACASAPPLSIAPRSLREPSVAESHARPRRRPCRSQLAR
eukprot:3134037-Prymnesium_polylepis.1